MIMFFKVRCKLKVFDRVLAREGVIIAQIALGSVGPGIRAPVLILVERGGGLKTQIIGFEGHLVIEFIIEFDGIVLLRILGFQEFDLSKPVPPLLDPESV